MADQSQPDDAVIPYTERLFHNLRDNLVAARPEHAKSAKILCPLCLRPLAISDVKSVEHIVPRNALENDPDYMKSTSLSRRAGLTVLCRESRIIGGKSASEGCNGWKGQVYDRLFKGMLQGQEVKKEMLWNRHSVAILTMAYLAGFQQYGYGYVLHPDFDAIREQFERPDDVVTPWLNHARVRLPEHDPNYTVWATTSGLPFVFGSFLTPNAVLQVIFRRFRALLPSGHWNVAQAPAVLLPAMEEA